MKTILYAFLAAVFYAINIPASKVLMRDVGPTTMAALLYLGAGIGIAVLSLLNTHDRKASAPLTRRDMPFVVGMIVLSIDEQPIWHDMTFSETNPIVAQWMVFVAGRQRFASRELPDDIIKKGDVEIPHNGAFVVALEYVCPFDIERRQFVTHRFNSAKAKSRGIPRLLGSLPISSVSRIAFNVSGL